ncbi:hypothetical protein SAMN05216223_12891 [Actinacidiphila yanglinensis]|uniref:Secreted protein n=1 Tax=Actinacidiphila yanglinensis TaxID=310779 RepID=A0A1H6EA81_9ACTN|nr:DUF5719 family protein [Actinacidiphila yanglinensis]SEG93834.1 hypothetical protein SAMN05216223_12891 [Actinacidiphila yanglinensis]
MNRSTLSLAGAVVALAVLTGAASMTGGSTSDTAPAASAARLPVQRSTLLCPEPSPSEFASTTYTSFTPVSSGPGTSTGESTGAATGTSGAKATLVPATTKPKALKPLTATGKPITSSTDKADSPALVGTADGALAPGWTVQQTTVVSDGPGRGVLGTSCVAPDSEFWFPGASTVDGRQDYVHLVNPDETPAVVDIDLYGKDGQLKGSTGDGITVPGDSSKPVLLSTLIADKVQDLTVHVVARSGRVGAAVQATDNKAGTDWLAAAAEPSGNLVMPGIPSDATDVRLITYATGSDDADLTLKLATSTGSITPAGHETLHVKSGMTTAVDLGDLTKGDAGSLIIGSSTSHDPVPVVAALEITRGKGSDQEIAFLPATNRIDREATVADNRAKGSTLALTATGKDVSVKITSSAGSTGGESTSKTVTVKAGSTLSMAPPQPSGLKGTFAVTVQRLSGGQLYASRMLALPLDGVPMFTIQPMPDDQGMVAVPDADADLRVLEH